MCPEADMSLPPAGPPRPEADARVPVFGTWRAIYVAVVAAALAVMALTAVFSAWPW
jgi:hypothetical protein